MSASPSDMSGPRMDALARLPVFFALQGRRVVVAGGHAAAAWKIELLAAAGAQVDVYAAAPSDDVRAAAQASGVTLNEREIEERDFADAVLAIGAFEDETAAATFAARARAAGVPVNVVDRPALSDFSFGTIVNRSPLVVGISTDGAAPVFAAGLRPGDIVVSFNGTVITDGGPLTRMIQDAVIGSAASVEVIREGRHLQ